MIFPPVVQCCVSEVSSKSICDEIHGCLTEHLDVSFQDVVWSDFGYPGRAGRESTLWIGTGGANTPCHQDTYGCNLVLPVQGR